MLIKHLFHIYCEQLLCTFAANPVSQITIQAPTELRFPEKIAVGDSQERDLTVRNTSGVACYYLVSCVSAYLNDYGLPVDMTGLSFNKTVPCSVDNVTDIKVILLIQFKTPLCL